MYMKNKYKIVDFFKGYAGGGHTSPEVWLETHVIPNISSNVEFVVDFGLRGPERTQAKLK